MDAEISRSPLSTVQLVPLFSYLNLMSDFLSTKQYLKKDEQYRQIPVVNALYEYLEQHRNHLPKMEELVRNLLQGSDLYGERDDENLDPIFVNTMFDYIISSLVFDKYGNIYGFLAQIVRETDDWMIDSVLKVIKETLKNAKFENENGNSSTLTSLAVDRIFNDIILPLFPQPETNMKILSLDYIFAQAGSMYLRIGRLNDIYYPDVQQHSFTKFDENLFNEYLLTGHILGNLMRNNEIDPLTVRVFALPVLFHYVSTKKSVRNEAITRIIFNPNHWKTAYKKFLQYVDDSFYKIANKLLNDNKYNMHLAFINFQSRLAIATSNFNSQCNSFSEIDKQILIREYLKNADHFQCHRGIVLPNINERFASQIRHLVEIYGSYELNMLQEHFSKYSLDNVDGAEIKLHKCELLSNGQCNNSLKIFYDLLEFYYPNNNESYYYALMRGNYSITLIKEADNRRRFGQKLGLSRTLSEFIQSRSKTVILKSTFQEMNVFFEELVKYKKERLHFYLKTANNIPGTNEWWKEFGLSLIPSYPCLLNNEKAFCKMGNGQFLNKFQKDVTSLLTQKSTQNMLSSHGVSIKTVFLKQLLDETIEALVTSQNISTYLQLNEKTMDAVFDTLSLYIEEPECESISINGNSIQLVKTVFDNLKEQMAYHFTPIDHMLYKMGIFKTNLIKNINFSTKRNQTLFVKTIFGDTGFGYRFIFTHTSISKPEIALFRTSYDYKEEMFVSLHMFASKNKKLYFKLKPDESLDYECGSPVFEINNQLRNKNIQILFSGITNYRDINNKCNINGDLPENTSPNFCQRLWKFNIKTQYKKFAEQLLKNDSIKIGKELSEEQIGDILEKYTFPDDETFIIYFVTTLLGDINFEKSEWSESCLIENSDLLNILRFNIRLENDNVTIADGESRINSIYTYRERNQIEQDTLLGNIINNYNDQEAGYFVTFEDYYAIRNFATNGYERIGGDTNEAKLMKLALYKLAIRQSDDPDHEYDLKLYRVESRAKILVDDLLTIGNKITINKFTSTFTSVESASRFSVIPASGSTNVLYVMQFFGPYFRAKIETGIAQSTRTKNIVLLPETVFVIKKVSVINILEMKNVLKVELDYETHGFEKHKWYKNIMNAITNIEI